MTHRHKKLEMPTVEVAFVPLAAPAVQQPTNEQIAERAYSFYVARGYQDGNQADDWFRAVHELRAELNA